MPNRVVTEMWPELENVGTVVTSEVEVDVDDTASARLKRTLFPLVIGSKFVPLVVIVVPIVPIAGMKPVIVGAFENPTVNTLLLVAEPEGEVTAIKPVVAPDGTVSVILVVVDDSTEATAPLNVTEF